METKTEIIETQAQATGPETNEVVVTKKGQTTIPVKLRRKYKIEEGSKLEVIDTGEGIFLKRKRTFWDMAGAYAGHMTVEEAKAELDKIRHEEDPDEQSYL